MAILYKREHICSVLPDEYAIEHVDGDWMFIYRSERYSFSCHIDFCPFCGEKLSMEGTEKGTMTVTFDVPFTLVAIKESYRHGRA